MMRKLSTILLILFLLTSCLSTENVNTLSEFQATKLKEALIDCELQALNDLDVNDIAKQCSEKLKLNETITAYSFLPQYDVLVQEYKDSFTALFNRVLVYELPNIKTRIRNLEIKDPEQLVNNGYQSVSWEIESLYKAEIVKEVYELIQTYQEQFIAETFKALETETMIWKTNQDVLNKIKAVTAYPTITAISLENSAKALTEELLAQLAFSEQRVRTKTSLELIYV